MNLLPHSAPLAADLIRVVPRAEATPFVPGKPWKYLNSTAFEATVEPAQPKKGKRKGG